MSQTLVQRPAPVHELSSREIINVDDLVGGNGQDDDVQLISHPVRRSLEPIVIEDSDDEVEIVAGPSRSAASAGAGTDGRRQIRHPSRRVLFSPPPPPQDNYIPPVPPLPPHARAEPPLRWHLTRDVPQPIRPLDQPLAFEQDFPIQVQPNVPRRPQTGAAAQNAARHSNMGFGGALFALNRQNQLGALQPGLQAPREEQNTGWRQLLSNFAIGPFRMLFQRPDGTPEPGIQQPFAPIEGDDPDLLEALALDAEERQAHQLRFRLYRRRAAHRNAADKPNNEEPSYKPSFTHPAKAEAGFSNDFAPHECITLRDGPGPSSALASDAHTVLVCAKCFDPLVMNVVGSEQEARNHKIFALRCGHILDGTCIDMLIKPAADAVAEENPADGNGLQPSNKGKGKANTDDTSTGLSTALSSAGTVKRGSSKRNKGKQKAVLPEENVLPGSTIPTKRPLVEASDPSEECIRLRLRPRLDGSGAQGPSIAAPADLVAPASEVAESSLLGDANPSSSTRKRTGARRGRLRVGAKGKSKGKGKSKANPPVVEAVYEWSCPVPDCGHRHKSVRILGVWHMDKQEGAIAMYV